MSNIIDGPSAVRRVFLYGKGSFLKGKMGWVSVLCVFGDGDVQGDDEEGVVAGDVDGFDVCDLGGGGLLAGARVLEVGVAGGAAGEPLAGAVGEVGGEAGVAFLGGFLPVAGGELDTEAGGEVGGACERVGIEGAGEGRVGDLGRDFFCGFVGPGVGELALQEKPAEVLLSEDLKRQIRNRLLGGMGRSIGLSTIAGAARTPPIQRITASELTTNTLI